MRVYRIEYLYANSFRYTWVLFSLICAVFTVGFGSPRLTDREIAPTRRLDLGQLQAWAEAAQAPDLSAKALIVYDVDSRRVLFKRDSTLALPPASLTKLMTSLLVLERGNLDATMQVQFSDLVGEATMGLRSGETLTVQNLLYGLLIPSGNDAAHVLARHVSGDVETFVGRMNLRAAELGLAQTSFVNPHGLDAEDHLSSASDLLQLALMNLEYPLFREIVETANVTIAGHVLRTTNQWLGNFPGVDGIKTGTTTNAGECLMASITQDGHQLLIALLGSEDRYADAEALYDLYTANYQWTSVDSTHLSVLNRLRGPNNEIWYLRPEGTIPPLLLRRWGESPLHAYRQLNLPPSGRAWQPGMIVGSMEWRLGDLVIGSQRLVLR